MGTLIRPSVDKAIISEVFENRLLCCGKCLENKVYIASKVIIANEIKKMTVITESEDSLFKVFDNEIVKDDFGKSTEFL